MRSEIVNIPFGYSIRLRFSHILKRLLAATATVLIRLSFLEERERLRYARRAHVALAAFDFRNAVRIFANQLAFRFRALWFVAFPVAFRFFTYRLTFGFRRLAVSYAVRLFADCYALGAVEHFTAFVGAFDFAFGFFAFYVADCVFRLGTGSVAFWGFADGIANCRAMGIIAFP